jgi:hypothetical protein
MSSKTVNLSVLLTGVGKIHVCSCDSVSLTGFYVYLLHFKHSVTKLVSHVIRNIAPSRKIYSVSPQ